MHHIGQPSRARAALSYEQPRANTPVARDPSPSITQLYKNPRPSRARPRSVVSPSPQPPPPPSHLHPVVNIRPSRARPRSVVSPSPPPPSHLHPVVNIRPSRARPLSAVSHQPPQLPPGNVHHDFVDPRCNITSVPAGQSFVTVSFLLLSCIFFLPPSFEIYFLQEREVSDFHQLLRKARLFHCAECSECFASFLNQTSTVCALCKNSNRKKLFQIQNLMHPGFAPAHLGTLSLLEEALLALHCPLLIIIRLKGGNFGYSGNCVAVTQDVGHFVTKLPRDLLATHLSRLPLTLPLRRQLRAVELAKAPPFLTCF